MQTRKIRIRIKASRREILRFGGQHFRAFCPECAREVETLEREQAGEILLAGLPELDRLMAAGSIHTIRTVSGDILVCKDSLF